MKTGVSVIIPCYNVEKYLDKCIDSILNQTYKNLEIILVDDCSKDKTWDIALKYSKKYDNIKAIKNEKNSGAGYSRNRALEVATYDYISFIDSDDFVEENFYEEMMGSLKKDKSDVSVCDIFVKYEDEPHKNIRQIACNKNDKKLCFVDNGLAASPCNKIIKKDLLLKYPFAEGIMNEDIPTIIAILIKAKKISYNENTYYNYVQHSGSVQNSKLSDKRLNVFKALDVLEMRIPRNKSNKAYWDAITYNQLCMFLLYVIPKDRNKKLRKEFLKKFGKLSKKYELNKNPRWAKFLTEQGKKYKIYYRFFMKFNAMGLYSLVNNMITFEYFYSEHIKKPIIKDNIGMDDLKEVALKQSKLKSTINLSVVVPNYNYEEFLYQRIYSILNQDVKISELIILDDVSKDNSRKLINKIVKELSPMINISKVYNETNSGSAFKQWKKGFELAKGDYVWIAEADDYCDSNFLKKVCKPLKDKDVVISYADTAFIDKFGIIIMRTIKPEIDILKTGHWDKSYVNDGMNEIENYEYLNCTIANVSSVIFKNSDYSKFFKESSKFKQAGDYLFYANIMSTGKVAYYNKPLNYYRVHGNNVTSTTKKQAHFNEIVRVHNYIGKMINLTSEQKKNIKDRYKFLERVWNLK